MREKLLGLAHSYLPGYLHDLAALVNVDSGTYSKAGVDAVGHAMRELLGSIGLEVEVHPSATYGDNLVGTLKGHGAARIVLIGHMDTVFLDGAAAERPFTVQGDRATGPGVADMKGGLVLACYALRALGEVGFHDFAEITFICNSDEEIGSPGSTELIRKIAGGADAALVLEPGRANGDVVSSRKGSCDYTLEVKGRAAHAGVDPDKGRSAVLEMAHKIIPLHTLNGLDPGTTVNVGVVQGGTRRNVVAEEARAEIDVRVPSLVALDRLERAMREVADRCVVEGTSTVLSLRSSLPPMEKTERVARLAEMACEEAAGLGFPLADASTGGASDGNTTGAMGVTTLDALGPVGGRAHSSDEYIVVSSVPRRMALLARLIVRIAESRPS